MQGRLQIIKSRRLRCETLARLICFCFFIAFLYFALKLLHLLPKSSTTVKRGWNGSSATLIPAFEGNNKRINILNFFSQTAQMRLITINCVKVCANT